MKLHRDWRRIMRHAWSVRFWATAFLCGGLETALPLLGSNSVFLTGLLGGLASVFGLAGLIARGIAQKEFEDGQT